MTIKRSFVRFTLFLLCLFSLGFVALRAVHGQRPQQPVKQTSKSEDYVIIEGDIEVSRAQYEELIAARFSPQSGTLPSTAKLWSNGIIPFEFDTPGCPLNAPTTCVSFANQKVISNTIAVLEAAAFVRFQQCPGNKCTGNFVHIQNDTGNSSQVGMQGGSQILRISSWASPFVIIHEWLHCLGFYHEQSRPDRGNFVTINCGNILGDSGDCTTSQTNVDFGIRNDASVYGYYDFDSLMHYDRCAFSVGCPPGMTCNCAASQETIQVKAPNTAQWQSQIGQRTHLSSLDALTLFFLYPRGGDWRFVDPTYTGGRGPSDGTFLRPYQSLSVGINATPIRGTLWLQPGVYRANQLTKMITIRAPLGGVTINRLAGVAEDTLASVSAASYNGELAAEAIAAAFGENLAAGVAVATSLPLPTTLGGVTVKVTDSAGVERNAPLFFVSSGQINYQIPAGASVGIAQLGVYNGDKLVAGGTIPIVTASPGLFSANSSGQGVPAALLLRVRGGEQFYEPLARYDAQQQQFVPVPIDLGPEGDQVFLILFGTGFRAVGTAGVMVMIGDEEAEVLYAGPAPGFAGLDQANVRVPRSLIGKGEVNIVLTADNRSANGVTVNIK